MRTVHGQQNDYAYARFRIGGLALRLQLLAQQLNDGETKARWRGVLVESNAVVGDFDPEVTVFPTDADEDPASTTFREAVSQGVGQQLVDH
jgi:hypothetical protein